MTKLRKYTSGLLLMAAVVAISVIAARTAAACTGIDFSIPRTTEDREVGAKYVFSGRTMEFGPDVTSWKLLYVPSSYTYLSCNVSGIDACTQDPQAKIEKSSWVVQHAYVGFTPMRPIGKKFEYTMTEITDGINDQGLYCGGFYHMGTEEYSTAPYHSGQTNMNGMDFPSWVLGNFATVGDLENALQDPNLQVRQFFVQYGGQPVVADPSVFPQLHYKVVDKSGIAIVVEFVGGRPKVFTSVGVITNNPTYDWQTTNLRNYVGLQTTNHEDVTFHTNYLYNYKKMSNGTGGIGLPGDFTSPSRFVRAMYMLSATLNNPAHTITDPDDAVLQAFRILNQFDIPEGAVVEPKADPNKVPTVEATSWTSMGDLYRLRYYYHTMYSRMIQMVDLGELIKLHPADKTPKPLTLELPKIETITNVTPQF
jgi:choloylglycine hydrolase